MELKEYLAKVMEQEREALDNALSNNAPDEVVAAIRRRLAATEEDLLLQQSAQQPLRLLQGVAVPVYRQQ